MNNAAASHVSMAWNLQGPSYTVATACASSNHAMGQAMMLIRAGQADVVLTGGSESMLCFGGIKAWEGLRVMSKDGCRPFSLNRNGMVQGEGAAVFVFEDYDHARARGAEILAEVTGFAMTSDATDIVTPNQDGAVRAMRGALRDAGLAPEAIGYINAHGTGTTVNDRTECAAVRAVFGAHADALLISSTKSMHGHLIGGTGAVELLACLMAVRDGVDRPDDQLRGARPRVRPRRRPQRGPRAPGRRGDVERLRLRRHERRPRRPPLRLTPRSTWQVRAGAAPRDFVSGQGGTCRAPGSSCKETGSQLTKERRAYARDCPRVLTIVLPRNQGRSRARRPDRRRPSAQPRGRRASVLGIARARWMPRSGAPNWQPAVDENGFMSWNRLGRSSTIRT